MTSRCPLIIALIVTCSICATSWGRPGEARAGWGPTAQTKHPEAAKVGAVRVAQTDADEPSPPGEAGSGEPGGPGSGEPGGPGSGEPGAKAEEPAGQPGSESDTPTVAKSEDAALHGIGIHVRGLFIPTWFLGLFLNASTPLNSAAIGGEYVRRKGNYDLVASVNFGFYSPADGNYLGRGKSPAIDTDYIQFRNLNVLAFEAAFVRHHYFLPWLSLVYGAGLGLGIVLGDIFRISAYQGNCHADNVGNLDQCNPVNPADTVGLQKWRDNRDAWLADAPKCEGKDSPTSPCQFREDAVWPVIPIVHLLLGVNFKINEQFSVRVDGGFHNAFYVGAGGHYFF